MWALARFPQKRWRCFRICLHGPKILDGELNITLSLGGLKWFDMIRVFSTCFCWWCWFPVDMAWTSLTHSVTGPTLHPHWLVLKVYRLVKLVRDLTRPKKKTKWCFFWKGDSPAISGKSRSVKYYNLARYRGMQSYPNVISGDFFLSHDTRIRAYQYNP